MSEPSESKRIKATILTHESSPRWIVQLTPETADLSHPGNTRWYLEFDKSAVVSGSVVPPALQSDLDQSTFDLWANASIKEWRITTVQEFFDNGKKFAPQGDRDDHSDNPNGTIGDPTSRSNLC